MKKDHYNAFMKQQKENIKKIKEENKTKEIDQDLIEQVKSSLESVKKGRIKLQTK